MSDPRSSLQALVHILDDLFADYCNTCRMTPCVCLRMTLSLREAKVAARLATLRDGQKKVAAPIGAADLSQPEAAELMNISRREVQRARKEVRS